MNQHSLMETASRIILRYQEGLPQVHSEEQINSVVTHLWRESLRMKDARSSWTPEAPEEPRWIPVGERLPEMGTSCLAMITDEGIRFCRVLLYCIDWDGEPGWWARYYNHKSVTHWMPLPELPAAVEIAPEPVDRAILEANVLGSMLLDPDSIGMVTSHLAAGDFLLKPDREIFQMMEDMDAAGMRIGLVTVRDELRRKDALSYAEYTERLISHVEGVPSAGFIMDYTLLLAGLVRAKPDDTKCHDPSCRACRPPAVTEELTACGECASFHEEFCYHCGYTGQVMPLCRAVKRTSEFDSVIGRYPDEFCEMVNHDGHCPHFEQKGGESNVQDDRTMGCPETVVSDSVGAIARAMQGGE